MKYIYLFVIFLFVSGAVNACEVSALKNPKVDIAQKLAKVDIRSIPCDSLETALSNFGKRRVRGGRRFEAEQAASQDKNDLNNSFCKDPIFSKKINAVKSISDIEVKSLIAAAILDEAGEYVARDMVLNNPGVMPCSL